MAASDDIRGQLHGLSQALDEYLTDAEEEVTSRRDRLKKIKDGLSNGQTVEGVSTSITEEYYLAFESFLFPRSS